MEKIPYFIISIRPDKKQEHEDFCGRISLMDKEFKEIAYVEFSKSKKEASIYIDYAFTETLYRQQELGRMLVSILENLARHLGISRMYSSTISDEGEFLMKNMGYKKYRKYKKGYYCKMVGRRKK